MENYKINFALAKENQLKFSLKELMQKENGIQQLLEISDEVLDLYYKAALHLLDEKRWKDASDAFLFLVLLNPFVHNYWIGAGIAEQSLGNFEQAIQYYVLSQASDSTDPISYAHAFQCCLALDETETAQKFLEEALECCGDKAEFSALKNNLNSYQMEWGASALNPAEEG